MPGSTIADWLADGKMESFDRYGAGMLLTC